MCFCNLFAFSLEHKGENIPFMRLFFILFGFDLQDYTHPVYRHPLSKTKSEIPLIFMILNIPWEAYCDVIPETIKWTKAMQLRERKNKSVECGNKQILFH